MLKNIYTPLAGAISQERALEAISNNLANLNTAGFKADNVTFSLEESQPYKNYPSPIPPANYKENMESVFPLKGNDLSYVGIASIERDFSQGPALATNNKNDMLLEGDGFFEVQTENGIRYMRSGDFSISSEGILVSKGGDPILGEKGAITLRGNEYSVNSKGEIFQDGQLVDRFRIMSFKDNEALERVGGNYYYFGGNPEDVMPSKSTTVRQGFLEGSNVNAIKSLTSMIISHRSYEAYQKAVSNFDQMMEKSSNSIGDVRA